MSYLLGETVGLGVVTTAGLGVVATLTIGASGSVALVSVVRRGDNGAMAVAHASLALALLLVATGIRRAEVMRQTLFAPGSESEIAARYAKRILHRLAVLHLQTTRQRNGHNELQLKHSEQQAYRSGT